MSWKRAFLTQLPLKKKRIKKHLPLFGEYLRVENVLQNYDEFAHLKALQTVDMDDPLAVEAFKNQHHFKR